MSDFYSELNESVIGTMGKYAKYYGGELKKGIKASENNLAQRVGNAYKNAGESVGKHLDNSSYKNFWKSVTNSKGELRDTNNKASKIYSAIADKETSAAEHARKIGNALGEHPRVATAGLAGAGTGTGIGAYLANKGHDAKDAVKSAGETVKSAIADHPKTAAAIGAATAAGLGALALRKKLASKKK